MAHRTKTLAALIEDASTVGRSLLTAATAALQRTALDVYSTEEVDDAVAAGGGGAQQTEVLTSWVAGSINTGQGWLTITVRDATSHAGIAGARLLLSLKSPSALTNVTQGATGSVLSLSVFGGYAQAHLEADGSGVVEVLCNGSYFGHPTMNWTVSVLALSVPNGNGGASLP